MPPCFRLKRGTWRKKVIMKINTSYLVAGAVIAALAVWFGVGATSSGEDIYADLEQKKSVTSAALPTVVIRSVSAVPHSVRLHSYGRTQANRMVELKAKTAASVTSTPIAEGRRVSRGTVVCRQDIDARQANVDQARAQLEKAQADFAATQTLVDKGYRSPTQLNGDRAAVDAAAAGLKSAEIELDNVNLRAPFSGIFEKRMAEVGDYLSPGQPCGLMVELHPLKVDVELTETQVGAVETGQDVNVKLATGQTVAGTVSYIESMANPATRTFMMETQIDNQDYALKAGVSATIDLEIGQTTASLIPSGILTLDEEGLTGIRYIDSGDLVRFAHIKQVDETREGLWVTGLPERARIIIEGQDYVSVGSKVRPVYESEARRDTPANDPSASLGATAKLD